GGHDDTQDNPVCQPLETADERLKAFGAHADLDTSALEVADDPPEMLRQLDAESRRVDAGEAKLPSNAPRGVLPDNQSTGKRRERIGDAKRRVDLPAQSL